MPHIRRQIRQHGRQVIPCQDPVFKAFDSKSMTKAVDSRAYGSVRDVGHKQIISEMVVCRTLVHLPHRPIMAAREKPRSAIAEPMEPIHKSENALA
jgi:hypothetical protein